MLRLSHIKEVLPKAVWIGYGQSNRVQILWLLTIKNNHQNMPFYIFSENKNNIVNVDLKTIYNSVMILVSSYLKEGI
jgi:hypothetical protein